MSTSSKVPWGLLPDDVLQTLKIKYWQNSRKLKSLLRDTQLFPLEVALKPPRGNAAIQNIGHFQNFVSSWKVFSQHSIQGSNQERSDSSSTERTGCEVTWEIRNFRSLAEQDVPTHLTIPNIRSLAGLLGADEENQLQNWLAKIRYLVESLSSPSLFLPLNAHPANDTDSDENLFKAFIDHLETIDRFEQSDLALLVNLLPQLQKGMGRGCYLRALPVTFVDTKFIEKNRPIIESVVATSVDRSVKDVGLVSWLDCKKKPQDWLLVKPLCAQTRSLLGGQPLLRLCSDSLQEVALPAKNILVIENEQACLALSDIDNTIAVSGGGKNVSWMQAGWLTEKNVAYWGDIDSEGFAILSDVRSKLSSITPLMMDEQTVKIFSERMVSEPDSVSKDPVALTEDELILFKQLRSQQYAGVRLEQERLPLDFVIKKISEWVA